MNKKDGIIVIERFQKGYLTAYSVDDGKSYHPSVYEALEHLDKSTNKISVDNFGIDK